MNITFFFYFLVLLYICSYLVKCIFQIGHTNDKVVLVEHFCFLFFVCCRYKNDFFIYICVFFIEKSKIFETFSYSCLDGENEQQSAYTFNNDNDSFCFFILDVWKK